MERCTISSAYFYTDPVGTLSIGSDVIVLRHDLTISFNFWKLHLLIMKTSTFLVVLNFLVIISLASGKKSTKENKPQWAKKDIRDYSDADLERLLDQWEVREC